MNVIFTLINFAILIFLLRTFLRAPIKKYFAERNINTEFSLRTAREEHLAAERRLHDSSQRLKHLDAELEKIVAEMHSVTDHECMLLAKRAKEQAQKMQDEALRQVKNDRLKTQEEIKRKILEKAFAGIEAELNKGLSEHEQNDIFQTSLSSFGNLRSFTPQNLELSEGGAA